MFDYKEMDFMFSTDTYANGGTYIQCDTDEGPFADISIWVDITPALSENEIVIPLYKLDKGFLDKVETYGFMKVDYSRPVQIGMGVGCIGVLTDDFKEKIDEINKKFVEKYFND